VPVVNDKVSKTLVVLIKDKDKTGSSEDFDQWAFATGRRRRAPHSKTDMLKG